MYVGASSLSYQLPMSSISNWRGLWDIAISAHITISLWWPRKSLGTFFEGVSRDCVLCILIYCIFPSLFSHNVFRHFEIISWWKCPHPKSWNLIIWERILIIWKHGSDQLERLERSKRAVNLINRKFRQFYIEAIPKKKSQLRKKMFFLRLEKIANFFRWFSNDSLIIPLYFTKGL